MTNLIGTYNRLPIDLVNGKGVHATDSNGKEYLDFCSGIAVNCLGHANPIMQNALTEQAGKIWHTSNIFSSSLAESFAEKLCASSFAEKVFFTNSGTEAVEGIIKNVRKYFSDKGQPNRNRIITFTGSFHGRSMGGISASGKGVEGFSPLLGGFDHATFNDLDSVKKLITENTAGILVEPIQGEGGVIVASQEFMTGIRQLCDENGMLLAFDEIQSGAGRTGTIWAHQSYGVNPDIMSVAKGIGGGFPVGAFMATNEVASAMCAGTHGSTYGGNPLAMAVGNAVFGELLKDGFLDSVSSVGDYLGEELSKISNAFSVRRKGLFVALVFGDEIDNADVFNTFIENGLLCVRGADNTVRLLPPLIISNNDVDEAITKIKLSLDTLIK